MPCAAPVSAVSIAAVSAPCTAVETTYLYVLDRRSARSGAAADRSPPTAVQRSGPPAARSEAAVAPTRRRSRRASRVRLPAAGAARRTPGAPVYGSGGEGRVRLSNGPFTGSSTPSREPLVSELGWRYDPGASAVTRCRPSLGPGKLGPFCFIMHPGGHGACRPPGLECNLLPGEPVYDQHGNKQCDR